MTGLGDGVAMLLAAVGVLGGRAHRPAIEAVARALRGSRPGLVSGAKVTEIVASTHPERQIWALFRPGTPDRSVKRATGGE